MIDNPPPWPDGKRCAVAFSFDVDAVSTVHISAGERVGKELAALAYMRYDPLVAIPRLTRLFADHQVPVSYFVPGWVIENYPHVVDHILPHGNEIAHHGYIHEWPNKLSLDEERGLIERASEIIERATGARPRGYRAPYYGISEQTVDLLIEAGFDYESSLFADDVPLVLDNGNGNLIEIPMSDAVDDYNQYVSARALDYLMTISSPERAASVFRAEFDAMWEYGGLWVGVWHPAVSGRVARAMAIRDLIEYMQNKGDVWFAIHEQVAAHIRGLIDTGSWTPRIDRLPLYPLTLGSEA